MYYDFWWVKKKNGPRRILTAYSDRQHNKNFWNSRLVKAVIQANRYSYCKAFIIMENSNLNTVKLKKKKMCVKHSMLRMIESMNFIMVSWPLILSVPFKWHLSGWPLYIEDPFFLFSEFEEWFQSYDATFFAESIYFIDHWWSKCINHFRLSVESNKVVIW